MKCRVKPLPPEIVEATQWDESVTTLNALVKTGMDQRGWSGRADNPDLCTKLLIRTNNGTFRVWHWDWIVKHADGRFEVYTNADFGKLFEECD